MFKDIKFNLKAIMWFVIAIGTSYLLIYFLSPNDFFKSPMYMILPIVGFLGMYFFSKYLIDYMQIKNRYYFALIFLIVGIVSYYVAIFFYYWNIILLNNIPISELFNVMFSNPKLFLSSAFLEFLFAGTLGVIASK